MARDDPSRSSSRDSFKLWSFQSQLSSCRYAFLAKVLLLFEIVEHRFHRSREDKKNLKRELWNKPPAPAGAPTFSPPHHAQERQDRNFSWVLVERHRGIHHAIGSWLKSLSEFKNGPHLSRLSLNSITFMSFKIPSRPQWRYENI